MGFKCPDCGKDFGYDKEAWSKQIINDGVDIFTPIKDHVESCEKVNNSKKE